MTASDLLIPLQDRTLSGSVWNVITCPRMELVAVVLDRNSVAICRTTWQRLATIPVCSAQDEVILSIAWSPDGANIVVGTSSQSLAVYSVDRCASTSTSRTKRASNDNEPILTRKLVSAPTALLWSTTPSSEATGSKASAVSAYADRLEKINEAKPNKQDDTCDGLIIVGDADGMMSILTHRLILVVARIPAAPDGFAVDQIHLTSSQQYCLSCSSSSPNETEQSNKSYETQRGLQAFHFAPVLEYWPEIDRLGRDIRNFNLILSTLSASVKKVREGWIKGALEILSEKIGKPLESLMAKFAEEGDSAWQALHDVYCGAHIKGSVLQFLANDLSEHGAKEALRSFRNHADDTEEAVFSMIPIAERTVFLASEYRGLARLGSRFRPVGVEFADAEKLFSASEKLLWALGDLVGRIDEVSQEAETFLAWLVTAAAKAGGESVQPRGPTSTDNMSAQDAKMISKFFERQQFEQLSNTKSPPGSVVELLKVKVEPALEEFQRSVEAIVAKPCETISSALNPANEISFSRRSRVRLPSIYSNFRSNLEDDHSHDVNVIETLDDGTVLRIHYDFAAANWTMRRYGLRELGLQVQNAIMIANDQLLVVTTEPNAAPGEERIPCDLLLYEFDSDEKDTDTPFQDRNGEYTAIPDATEFCGRQLDSKPCGSIKQNGDISISAVNQLGLTAVLAAPRKISLFQTPHRDADRDVEM